MSRLDLMVDRKADPVRRIEVINGTGRRRRWSEDDKARVLEESLRPGAIASEVARRHGLTPQQLFTWRRRARLPADAGDNEPPAFVPTVVDPPKAEGESPTKIPKKVAGGLAPIVELEIGLAHVWIWRDAEPAMVRTIIGALKDSK